MSVRSDNKPTSELLAVTESAVQGLNKPHCHNQNGVQQQSAFSRKQRSDYDAHSSSSESTTESHVLINSTNMAVDNSRLKVSSQVGASQQMDSKVLHPVRVPASILREVKSPFEGDCFRSGYVVDKSDRNFVNISLSGLPSGAETQLVDVENLTVSSTGMEPVALNSVTAQHLQSKVKVIKPFEFDRTIAQAGFRPIMTDMSSSGQSKMSHGTDSRPAESSTGSNTEPDDFAVSSDKPKRDHPLMVILDSGYLTQPINAVVREETGSSLSPSEASTRSPIVVHAKNRAVSPSETGSTYSTSSQSEVVTVSGVTVPVLPRTASAVTVDSSDTDNLSARPFVALKDRFHKFRPVTVKQGTEMKDSVAHPVDCIVGTSDELRVEHFKLTEKEARLRQEFLNRQKNAGAAPVKKFVPAHVVQSMKDVEVKATTETSLPAAVQPSATVTADSVATTAVAAVMASQTFMKVQQDLERQMSEVLTKISALQESSKQTLQDPMSTKTAQASPTAATNNADVEMYRKKMEELEKQLSGLTQQRLDYLEKLHQQQLDIQMQLLAMGKQNVAVGHVRSHTYDVGSGHIDRPVISPPTRNSKSDTAIGHGIELEKAALLDTPAPRKQRPVPTFFDPVSVPSIPLENEDLRHAATAYDYQPLSVANSLTPPKQRQPVAGPVLPGYRSLNPGGASSSKNVEDERINNSRAQYGVQSTEDMYAKKLNDTFSLTPEKRLEPAPLDKYLMNPSTGPVDISPYPSLKKTMSSHMPALLQYAEAEALLKKVQATSKRLESNIDTVLKARQDVDLLVGQSGGDDDSSCLMERIRVRKLVDQRVQAISKQLEVEIEQERIKVQNEKNRQEAEAKQNAARVAKFRGAGYQQPRHSTAAAELSAGKVVKLVAEKENVPKKVPFKKPRPLDPVQDEEYMKRIYGKALYHKQRNAQRDACQRYHGSPKSKLPQSPVRMSRAVVKGVEVAAAKTQTTATVPPLDEMCYNRPVKGHFVVGLKGKLIPVAIPVDLPKQSDRSQHYRPVSRSPPMHSRSPPRQPSPVLQPPPPPVEVKTNDVIADDEDDEVEESDSTLIEDKPMISLPGHTAPPVDGSKFPARKVPLLQHEESADDIAAKIRRSEMLHSELINMVEQELLARIIFEMQEKGMAAEPVNDPTGFMHVDQSETSVESEDASEAFIADAIGPQGVQMFVDAGQPVNNALVTALVRDVLAERIAAMLGERAELDRLAKQRLREERQREPYVSSGQAVVEDPSSRVPRFPVATPQPTPVPSPVHSPSRTPSPLETPLASVAVIIPPQQPVVEEQPSDDEEDFPSYHGASDVESEKASTAPFVEHHGVRTPSITPTYSPVRSIGTPSLSQEEFLPPAVVALPSVVEKPPSPVVTAVRDAAVDCQLLPVEPPAPPERPPSPSPPSLSTEVESEAPPSEEESLTINECISEGQWLVSVLSEGEVPDAHMHEALRNRIRQHLMNGSRHRQMSDDEETVANSEELDQDDRFTGPRSEGEVYHATHPSAEQAAMLDILMPKPSMPPAQRVVTASKRQPLSSQRSMGEISVGQVQSYDDIYMQPYGGGVQPARSSRRSPSRQPYVGSDSVFDAEASAGEYNPGSPTERQRRLPTSSSAAAARGSPSPPPPPQRVDARGEPSYVASKSGGGPVKQQGQKQRSPVGTGRISSTLEPNAVRKYQQPAGKFVDFSQPDSPHLNQAATLGSTFGRTTVEAGNATQSDLMTRTTATTDRMSPNALLASRDYFGTASDFGATASSVGSDVAVPRKLPPGDQLRATLDTADSLQFTDTAGDESDAAAWRAAAARDTYGSDSLADTVGGGNLRATFSVPQQHSHLPIKIPTIGVDNEDLSASDEISEVSVELEMA